MRFAGRNGVLNSTLGRVTGLGDVRRNDLLVGGSGVTSLAAMAYGLWVGGLTIESKGVKILQHAKKDHDGGVGVGLEEAFWKIGDARTLGVSKGRFAFEASNDVVGEGIAIEDGYVRIGDEEETGIMG